jgi:AraC-like DNA-binding protein
MPDHRSQHRKVSRILPTQILDTTTLPEADRLDFWRQLIGEHSPAYLYSPARGFAARAQTIDLGGLRMSRFRYPELLMKRTSELIRQGDPESFQLALTMGGASVITQVRRESAIEGAGLTLIDNSRPFEAFHRPPDGHESSRTIVVDIPHAQLPLSPAKVTQLLACNIPADTGMGALLGQFLRGIAEHPEQYRPADGVRLGAVGLDLVAAALAHQLDATRTLPVEVQQTAMRARVVAFVDRHLGDADLTPRAIAVAHHISLRSLHRLFEDDDVTVAEMIRIKRLEKCRRDLTNPLLAQQPAYAIGARWGFSDKSHFSRLFRSRYGNAPQTYREQHQLSHADGPR